MLCTQSVPDVSNYAQTQRNPNLIQDNGAFIWSLVAITSGETPDDTSESERGSWRM